MTIRKQINTHASPAARLSLTIRFLVSLCLLAVSGSSLGVGTSAAKQIPPDCTDSVSLPVSPDSTGILSIPLLQQMTDIPYMFGIVNDSGTHYDDEWKRGVRATVLELNWRAYEPSEGIFDPVYISHMQQVMKQLKTQGWYVQLVPGFQYAPSWIFSNYANMYFINQYGDQFAPDPNTQGDHQAINAPFNPQARALEASYIARIFQDFNQADPNYRFNSIRIGGGVQGELRYPPAKWNGHKNSYWAYDVYAQNQTVSGIPSNSIGWRPGIDANPGTTGHGQLIINPGFESTDSYFPVLGWSQDNEVNAAVTLTDPHSGQRSLQVDINTSGRIHQFVRVEPGTNYDFSVWVKSGNGSGSARLFVNQYQTQSQASSTIPVKLESWATSWTRLNGSLVTDATTHFLKVELDGSQAGSYYFDDLSLMRVGETNTQDRDISVPLSFYNWYVQSMTNYQNWQIDQFRLYFGGQLDLLYAGKGVLPKFVMEALTNDLLGDGWSESNSALYGAALYDRHVAGLKSTTNLALYVTGLEDMPASIVNDASPYPSEWSAARWIASLAKSRGLPVWGENGGENSNADLQLAVQRMSENHFLGLMWVFETELYSKTPGYASIDQFTGQIQRLNSPKWLFLPYVNKK